MKQIILILTLSLLGLQLVAQAPQGINYQSVARDNMGNPIPKSSVTVNFKIRQGSASGNVIFEETQNKTTDACGLFNLKIGQANAPAFGAIDWSTGSKFLEVTINGSVSGTTEILSVPYALYAEKSGAAPAPNIAIFEEQKGPGNDFQGTVGPYTKRLLNVEVLSSPSVGLTANNEIRFVAAGLYLVTGSAYALDKGNHKIVLRHNGSIVLEGTSEVNRDQVQDASNRSFIMGTISVPQGTNSANPYLYTLDHYSSSVNQGTFGNGINATGSNHETYSQLMIQKIQ